MPWNLTRSCQRKQSILGGPSLPTPLCSRTGQSISISTQISLTVQQTDQSVSSIYWELSYCYCKFNRPALMTGTVYRKQTNRNTTTQKTQHICLASRHNIINTGVMALELPLQLDRACQPCQAWLSPNKVQCGPTAHTSVWIFKINKHNSSEEL